MTTLIFQCPTTGHLVQGWFADHGIEDHRDVYEPITCLACRRVHNVNPKTGLLAAPVAHPFVARADKTRRIGVLMNSRPDDLGIGQFAAIQSAASSFSGIELSVIDPRDANEMERAMATFGREPNGGIITTASPSAAAHRKLIISLFRRYRLPDIYPFRYYPADGGLASYGPDPVNSFKRAAEYVDRILKGAKPSELPTKI
jgi:hypothetical protein